jgi:hypothetical protein
MKKLLFILLIAVVATGCKKEKKIERNLWKKGGEWEIKSFEESYESSSSPEYNYTSVIQNGGTFQFEKDGTGKTNYSSDLAVYLEDVIDEEYINTKFSYHNTENSVFFIYPDDGGLAFDLEWDKDKIIMSYDVTQEHEFYDGNNNLVQLTTNYSLKFICEKK